GFTVDGSIRTLTEHWNGNKWRIVLSPNPDSTTNNLWGVAAVAPDDVWAVGDAGNGGQGNSTDPLAIHWDGAAWAVVPTPAPGIGGRFEAVSTASSDRAWAVGFYATFTSLTLAERWNGLKWKVTPSESPGTTVNVLSGVSATSRRTAWSVGATSSSSEDQELAEHVC